MSEEKSNEIIIEPTDSTEHLVQKRPNRLPVYVALATLGVVIIGAFLIWMFRSGETGQDVPAPTSVTFGDKTTGEPAEGETLTIAPDQVEKIGLKIETVGETLSSEAISVAATGVIEPNAYKETPLIPLVSGILRSVSGELGQNVARGQSLAVIFSDELAASQARYLTLQTEAQTARQNYDRTAKLVKISPVSSNEVDEMLARLKIAQAELEEHHKHHARTIKLLEIGAASREEFEMATTELKTAEAKVEESKKRYDRAVEVAEINPQSRTEFEQAAVKRQMAESELVTARERLILLGLPPHRVNSLRSPSQITSVIALTAPVAGTITKRSGNAGEVVEANKELMRVTDLSTVWVIAQVYERDISQLRTGSGASVTTDAYPGRLFRGHVTYIDPNIDQATRTAQVRVELENPGQILKLGMYVNVAFGSMGTAERTVAVVPATAVQTIGDRKVVFEVTTSPNIFLIKTIRTGTQRDGKFTVLEGLHVGDRIVTEGSFLLRAELLKQNPM